MTMKVILHMSSLVLAALWAFSEVVPIVAQSDLSDPRTTESKQKVVNRLGGPLKTGEKKNLLLTAKVKDPGSPCPVKCQQKLDTLVAATECAARAMGPEWEAMAVTHIDNFEEVRRKWPFIHYVKIYLLEELIYSKESSKFDWFLWADSDVRIVNTSYPISNLLDDQLEYERPPYYGTKVTHQRVSASNDVSIIATGDQNGTNIINNFFLIKNNPWGERFVQAWKYYSLHGQNKDQKPRFYKTCGFFDQCPFLVAMLQVAQDYHYVHEHQNGSLNGLMSLPWNATIEQLAFRSGSGAQYGVVSDELVRLMSTQDYKWTETNVPLQIGPVLIVPTWEGGMRLPLTKLQNNNALVESDSNNRHELMTSLTVEPVGLFDGLSPWPFAIHADYSPKFCCHRPNCTRDFEMVYKGLHREQCTPDQFSVMWRYNNTCWG